MKTKFILYGGFDPNQKGDGNADFSKEILREAPEGTRVLIVPFSKEVDRIIPTTQRVSDELNAQKWQNNIDIEVANQETFVNQVALADIIYFQGGSSSKLLGALKQYPNLEQILIGKTVAGDSGVGNVLSKYFYSPSSDSISEGLGILPVIMIPHYKEEYKDKLDSVGQGFEEVFLPEYTFKVFYK